jgi:hypothetical protein
MENEHKTPPEIQSPKPTNLENAAAERAALDKVVFNLTHAYENPPPSTFIDYSKLLERHTSILNAAFEYYLDKAVQSSNPDRKIQLAMQMQSRVVRAIDAWRRLEKFLNEKTK